MKTTAKAFRGIFPPVSTYLDAQGNFDPTTTAAVLDHLIHAGVHGVLLLGSAGEFFSMSARQRKEVAEFCLKHIAGRISTLVGTGCCGTAETIELSVHAAQHGADGVMVINPYYSPMSEDCLYNHYTTVANATPIPVLLYNFPAMTGQDISVELIARLAKHPNIRGLKDSVTEVAHTRRVLLEVAPTRADFDVFCGFDEHLLNTLILGGAGGIPGTANFAPQVTCGIYAAFQEKSYAKAQELQNQVSMLSNVYALESPYFGTLKEAVKLCGMPHVCTAVLPPSSPLSENGKRKLHLLLQHCKVL